jgi:hypothetical protein
MSTYYLFDMHVPTIADARIVDVVMTSGAQTEFRVDGLIPVKIPEGIRVDNPSNLSDLLAQKYQGILAQYPGFARIVYDDLLDPDDVFPIGMGKLGSRSTIGGHISTTTVDLFSTVLQFILVYEHNTWRYVDSNGRIERYYVEQPEGLYPARATLNYDGAGDYTETTSGALVVVNPGEEGSSLRAEFLMNGPLDVGPRSRLVHTGSWSVIY